MIQARNLALRHEIREGRQSIPATVILRVRADCRFLGQLPKSGCLPKSFANLRKADISLLQAPALLEATMQAVG